MTTAIALAPADPSRTASASSALATTTATYGLRLRDVTSRGRDRSDCGSTGGGSVEKMRSSAGRLTAPAARWSGVPQRDVHCPVVASVLAELARAVERIDDPHPVGVEAAGVLQALLRQHGVVGPGVGQLVRR